MKVTVINGSPRGKKSATQIMVNEFLKGMEDAGAETSCIFYQKRKSTRVQDALHAGLKPRANAFTKMITGRLAKSAINLT